jgi:hypothetical protein
MLPLMPTALEQLRAVLAHPAPGLLFAPHERAGAPERVYATPHEAGKTPPNAEIATLTKLASANPAALGGLVEVYSAMNGVSLCVLYEDINDRDVPAIAVSPIAEWEEATEPWVSGEMAGFMDGCEMYGHGTWRVIGTLACEGQSLVMFFDGEHEGQPLAGRMFCIGLDGYLGYEELLAPSFDAFVSDLTSDPAALLNRVGFSWHVTAADGAIFGDPPEAYLRDVRGHRSLTEWVRK